MTAPPVTRAVALAGARAWGQGRACAPGLRPSRSATRPAARLPLVPDRAVAGRGRGRGEGRLLPSQDGRGTAPTLPDASAASVLNAPSWRRLGAVRFAWCRIPAPLCASGSFPSLGFQLKYVSPREAPPDLCVENALARVSLLFPRRREPRGLPSAIRADATWSPRPGARPVPWALGPVGRGSVDAVSWDSKTQPVLAWALPGHVAQGSVPAHADPCSRLPRGGVWPVWQEPGGAPCPSPLEPERT